MTVERADDSTTVQRTRRKLLEELARQEEVTAEKTGIAGGSDKLVDQALESIKRSQVRRDSDKLGGVIVTDSEDPTIAALRASILKT